MVAGCRKPDDAAELQELQGSSEGRLTLVPLDLTQEDTIQVCVVTSCGSAARTAAH